MQSKASRSAVVFAVSIAVMPFALSSPALAQSVCKGMQQESCETTENCRWQAGYTRKDGIAVVSHCRSSGKKKEVAPEASAPATSAPEASAPAAGAPETSTPQTSVEAKTDTKS